MDVENESSQERQQLTEHLFDIPQRLTNIPVRKYGCFVLLPQQQPPGPGTYWRTRQEYDCISYGTRFKHPTCRIRNAINRMPREFATSLRSETDDSFATYDIHIEAIKPKTPVAIMGPLSPTSAEVYSTRGGNVPTQVEKQKPFEVKKRFQHPSRTKSRLFGTEERQLTFSPCQFPRNTKVNKKYMSPDNQKVHVVTSEQNHAGPKYFPKYDLIYPRCCTQIHAMNFGDISQFPSRNCLIDIPKPASEFEDSPGPIYYPHMDGIFPNIKTYRYPVKMKNKGKSKFPITNYE